MRGPMLAREVVPPWDEARVEETAIERHRYTVEGWGSGELQVRGDVVLAHDLLWTSRDFAAVAPPGSRAGGGKTPASTRGPRGPARHHPARHGPAPEIEGARPPEFTLAEEHAQVSNDFVSDLVARIRRQLAGCETAYADVRIDLAWCTPFQASLAEALRAVPWGDVVTYGELAALAGRPGAARAAGSFCAQNRFWLLLPCHRVVAAGGIGGYGDAGVGLKQRLLALEGVEL